MIKKPLLPGLIFLLYPFLACFAGAGAFAQTVNGGAAFTANPGLSETSPSPSPEPEKKKSGETALAPQGPTVIDSENMDYDEKTRVAIFTGDYYGVFLKDPQFTVNCDKLTAYMRKGSGGTAGQKGKRAAMPSAPPAAKGSAADAAASKGNGLQRALAEGTPDRPVVIVQDKPATNGEQAQHNVGIAEKADYNADTGDVVLTGWPRVSQGVNTQIATSRDTIMTMNRDGRTMKTRGPSRSIIQEQDQTKKTGTDAEPPAESPTPSQQ